MNNFNHSSSMTRRSFPSLPTELVLHIASYTDDSSLLSLLLCNRALSDIVTPVLHTRALTSRGSQSAIQWAANRGHLSLVKVACPSLVFPHPAHILQFLLSHGIHPDTGATTNEPAALRAAVANRRFDIAELLLIHGADVNSKIYTAACGFLSPIHTAATRGDTEMIALLATHGADLAFRDRTGVYAETPLHVCVFQFHVDAVRMLLDLHVPVDAVDTTGVTPLDLATVIACGGLSMEVLWERIVEIGVMLVKAGAVFRDRERSNMAHGVGLGRSRGGEWRRILIAAKRDADGCE